MNFRSIIKLSVQNLRSNPLRSFLTMLGLIIGIGSVVLIISVGAGAQVLVLSQVNKIGSDLIGILPGASDAKGPPASVFGIQVKTLVNDDIKVLQANAGSLHIKAVAGYAQGQAKMVYEDRVEESGTYMGVSAAYPQVENVTLAQGAFFTETDDETQTRVVVLGSEIAQNFFDGDSPLGKTIKIKRESFKVVGVLATRGSIGFSNMDKMVLIPLQTAQKIMLGWRHLSLIRAKVDGSAQVDSAIDGIKQILRVQHKIDRTADDDFTVRAAAQAIDMLKTITSAFSFFLAAIAAISLLVGGIGIMNIMLVAVTERFKEIGLRKAVGATNASVLKQFLLETIMVTTVGSLIGIVGGAAVSFIISLIVKYLKYDWAFIISLSSVVVAAAVGTAIGLIFGYYPARRAARLDPIAALRYE